MCMELYARMGDRVKNQLREADINKVLWKFLVDIVNWFVYINSTFLLLCLPFLEDRKVEIYICPAPLHLGIWM